MMQRLLSQLLLVLCLSLIGCDKQDTLADHKDAGMPGRRTLRLSPSVVAHQEVIPSPDVPAVISGEVSEMDASVVREMRIAEIAWNALETNPDLAWESFLQLPTGCAPKIRLIQHYAMCLAEQDVEEALDWASALQSESEVFTARCQIALVMAESDPLAAANLLAESGLEGRELDVAVVQVVQRWAAQSPPDAAAWLAMFPSGPAREAGVKMVAEQWLPRDASAAFAWLGNLNDPAIRMETARAMEGVILQQSASIRETWLQHADERIQSEFEQQRVNALMDVGNNIRLSENGSR